MCSWQQTAACLDNGAGAPVEVGEPTEGQVLVIGDPSNPLWVCSLPPWHLRRLLYPALATRPALVTTSHCLVEANKNKFMHRMLWNDICGSQDTIFEHLALL